MSSLTKTTNSNKKPQKPAAVSVAKPTKTEPEAPTKEPALAAEPAPVEVPAPKAARKARKDAAPQIIELRVGLIELDGTQTRAALNKATVQEYSEQMSAGARFPAITVFNDGENFWLADGHHRVHAAIKLGLKKISAEVHKGDRRDAVLFGAGSNADHGLRRTNKDKRNAVATLLHDDEWSKKSDRWIGEICAVSNVFVSKLRSELLTVNSSVTEVREGQDGKVRKIKPNEQARAAEAVPLTEASALADLQGELERRLASWTWEPHALASLLESCATKARESVKEAANA